MKRFDWSIPAAFALAIALAAAPAAAQGKSGSHGGGHGDARTEHVTRSSGTHVERSSGTHVTRRTTTRTRAAARRTAVAPGWCQGRGNPHNTAANCGYRTDRIYRDRNGVWRDRYGNRLRSGYIYRDRSGSVRNWLGRILG